MYLPALPVLPALPALPLRIWVRQRTPYLLANTIRWGEIKSPFL